MSYYQAFRPDDCAFADRDAVSNPDLTGDLNKIPNFNASGKTTLRRYGAKAADADVVANVDLAINFRAFTYDRIRYGAAANSRSSADFDIIIYNDSTDVWNL